MDQTFLLAHKHTHTGFEFLKGVLPVLGDPGEEGLAVAPLGFAEVAGSDWTWRANLQTGHRAIVSSP